MGTKLLYVRGCARCGDDHPNLTFLEFTNPVEVEEAGTKVFTHFATCPTTQEPILMAVEECGEESITDNR